MPSECPKCHRKFSGPSIGTHAEKCGVTATELFWAKVRKGERCWIWTGAKHRWGYGACNKEYGDTRAHRVAWTLTNGPIPEGKVVCHKCETKLCVNPAHLFVGTQADNMADNKAKGKSSYGEKSIHAKLTDALVLEIRRRFKFTGKRKTNARELAADYGVAPQVIYLAGTGRTWKHLPTADGVTRSTH
jgi:hypothetical protein